MILRLLAGKLALLVGVIAFSVFASAPIYSCHFQAAVSLTQPYDVAHCRKDGQITWGVGFEPKTNMLYVLPKLGELWYVSPRPNEQFSSCDADNHCFVLHVKQIIVSEHDKAIGVEFWGTAWK